MFDVLSCHPRSSTAAAQQQHRGCIVAAPRQHRGTAAAQRELGSTAAARQHSGSSAAAWRQHGGSIAVARRQYGGSSAAARRQHNGSTAATQWQHGGSTAAPPLHLRDTFSPIPNCAVCHRGTAAGATDFVSTSCALLAADKRCLHKPCNVWPTHRHQLPLRDKKRRDYLQGPTPFT
jgi:hypothetical protein